MAPRAPRRRPKLVDRALRPYDALADKLSELSTQGQRAELKIDALQAEINARRGSAEKELDALRTELGRQTAQASRKIDALQEELRKGPAIPSPEDRSLNGLTEPIAQFMNLSYGPQGYAAQAGVWRDPEIVTSYGPGKVDVIAVTERIVEIPWVFVTVAPRVSPGGRILDLGGGSNTVALSLASLGYRVTLVDPQGAPVAHPNLDVHRCRADELDPTLRDFDAVVAMSSVEHFGLGHYDGDTVGTRMDLAAMNDARKRCRSGAVLALTVPLGLPSVSDYQRVYDEAGVRELTAGWDELELRTYVLDGSGARKISRAEEWAQFDPTSRAVGTTWRSYSPGDSVDCRAVALYAGELN